MKKKIDYLIIPCPGNPTIKKGKYSYPEIYKDMYLGGQTRMKAAAYLWEKVENYVLVGGSIKKVKGMFKFLSQKLGDKLPNVIGLISYPNTLGNIWAIRIWNDKKNIKLKSKKIAVLSNEYHNNIRIKLFAKKILPDFKINYLQAEKILKKNPKNKFKKEYQFRVKNDTKGKNKWIKGKYKNQDNEEKDWKCRII